MKSLESFASKAKENMQSCLPIVCLRLHQWLKHDLVVVLSVLTSLMVCVEISLWRHHFTCNLEQICNNASNELKSHCENMNSLSQFVFLLYTIQIGLQTIKIVLNLNLNHIYLHIDQIAEDKFVSSADLLRCIWNVLSDIPIALLLFLRCLLLPILSLGYESEMPRLPGNFIIVVLFLFIGSVTMIVDSIKLVIARNK